MSTVIVLFLAALTQPAVSPPALMAEARVLLDSPQTAERMQRIETLLTELSRLEDYQPEFRWLDTRFGLHTEMLERYRSTGNLSRVRAHAEWIVRNEHLVHDWYDAPSSSHQARPGHSVEQVRVLRRRHSAAFVAARIDVARAVLADGDREKAILWLETGEKCLGDVSGAVKALRAERERMRR